MRRPFTALAAVVALLAAACGNDPKTIAAEKIAPDPAALARLEESVRDGHSGEAVVAPLHRDLSELSPAVLYDVPDDLTPVDEHGQPRPERKKEDWRPHNTFVLGTVTAVDRGKVFRPLGEHEDRDPLYGDHTEPRDCMVTDLGCDTAYLHIDVERSYPAGAANGEIVVVTMPVGEFVSFASAVLALGRAVFIVSANEAPQGRYPKSADNRPRGLFASAPSMPTFRFSRGWLYTIAPDGTLALPFMTSSTDHESGELYAKLAAASLASTPTLDSLFERVAVERTIPLRYGPGSGDLERVD